ncbi:MAG: hypothetical protein ACRDN9_12620 [Streptosporangiaceae bacterium]
MAAGACTLLDAIGADRKTLMRLTDAEGAGGHCEGTARRLYHQRVYDWLDGTLRTPRSQTAPTKPPRPDGDC